MFRISDIRIGTKLAIASGIGMALVACMMASQWINDSRASASSELASRQKSIAMDAIDAKASQRGMQIAVRDARLAKTPEQAKAAKDYLDARLKSIHGFIGEMLALSSDEADRERMKKFQA